MDFKPGLLIQRGHQWYWAILEVYEHELRANLVEPLFAYKGPASLLLKSGFKDYEVYSEVLSE